MELTYATVSSPVGTWTVEGTTLGVTKVFLPHETAPPASATPDAAVATAARQLDEYFHGARQDFDVVLADATATQFQHDVWRVLQSLPFGSVATYADVAGLAGRPRAARAVGNANHANPWPVIVPCHRVVASQGIGGYGGGKDVKRYLLSLEGIDFA
jgi:methylated-DNA-[protein]-cysteine S-methyltransferase